MSQLTPLHSWIIDSSVDLVKQAKITFKDIDTEILKFQQDPQIKKNPDFIEFMDFYQRHLTKFFNYFLNQTPDIFNTGYYLGFYHANKESTIQTYSKKEDKIELKLKLPNTIFAFNIKNPQEANDFVQNITKRLEKVFWQYFLKKDHGPALFERARISSQTAYRLRIDRLVSLISKGNKDFSFNGDFDTHIFVYEDYLVMSTSKSLTSQFIQLKSDQKDIEVSANSITKANLQPSAFSEYIECFSKVMENIHQTDYREESQWFQQMLNLIETVKFNIDQNKNGYIRTYEGQIAYP